MAIRLARLSSRNGRPLRWVTVESTLHLEGEQALIGQEHLAALEVVVQLLHQDCLYVPWPSASRMKERPGEIPGKFSASHLVEGKPFAGDRLNPTW